jgi:ATP synthase protein I
MNRTEPNNGKRRLVGAVRRRQWERREWETRGERSVWRNLAMFGALGWLIIIPTLIGLVAGRWLDGILDTGITMTAAGIFVGVCVGGLLAWQRMNRE